MRPDGRLPVHSNFQSKNVCSTLLALHFSDRKSLRTDLVQVTRTYANFPMNFSKRLSSLPDDKVRDKLRHYSSAAKTGESFRTTLAPKSKRHAYAEG